MPRKCHLLERDLATDESRNSVDLMRGRYEARMQKVDAPPTPRHRPLIALTIALGALLGVVGLTPASASGYPFIYSNNLSTGDRQWRYSESAGALTTTGGVTSSIHAWQHINQTIDMGNFSVHGSSAALYSTHLDHVRVNRGPSNSWYWNRCQFTTGYALPISGTIPLRCEIHS